MKDSILSARCSNCFFFEPYHLENGEILNRGYCHFSPPVPIKVELEIGSFLPETRAGWFCGNHPYLQATLPEILIKMGQMKEKDRNK